MCSRPLGSVSCTRSPARNGPDPGAALTLIDRCAASSCAKAAARSAVARMPAGAPSRIDDEVLAAPGSLRTASSRSSPDSPRGRTSPASSGRATSRSGTHGRRSGGDGVDPRLVDDRGRAGRRRRRPRGRGRCPATAGAAPRRPTGRRARAGPAAAARSRSSCGSRVQHLRVRATARRRPTDRRRARRRRGREDVRPGAVGRARADHEHRRRRRTRPAQAPTTRAGQPRLRDRPDRRAQQPAAVERQAGQQVEHDDDAVAPGQQQQEHAEHRVVRRRAT